MKIVPYVLSCALLTPVAALAGSPPTSLGESLTLSTATPIATILARPADFDGRRVQVHGQVAAVCEMKGCWLLVADGEGHEIRVKVADDGPIVFPKDAPGGQATVEGTVRQIAMTRDQYVAWHRHLAEESGGTFDDSNVGAGPFERVEIAGLGARLEAKH